MTKKHFVLLADMIKEHNRVLSMRDNFSAEHLDTLASFCKRVNSNFNRDRWLDYIAGKCGPNGGAR